MLTLIVAHDRNRAIGRAGKIPWSAPADLVAFRRETMGGTLIMGRKTWESIGGSPLEGRLSLVVSRDRAVAEHVFPSPEAALDEALRLGHTRIYGAGGEAVYKALMPVADRLLVTEVDVEVPNPDAYFPWPDDTLWQERRRIVLDGDDPACVIREMLRVWPTAHLPQRRLRRSNAGRRGPGGSGTVKRAQRSGATAESQGEG